jgi:hypothetical protein
MLVSDFTLVSSKCNHSGCDEDVLSKLFKHSFEDVRLLLLLLFIFEFKFGFELSSRQGHSLSFLFDRIKLSKL